MLWLRCRIWGFRYAGDLDSPAVVKFTKLKPIELDFEVRDPHHAASATFRPQKAAARFSWRWCTHDHLTWEGSGEGEHADEDDCLPPPRAVAAAAGAPAASGAGGSGPAAAAAGSVPPPELRSDAVAKTQRGKHTHSSRVS